MYIYTMEYYSAIKKRWNFAICNNMNTPRGYYAKWKKSQNNMTSLTCRIRKTKQANKAKWKETHRYREQIVICQRGGYERWGKRWKGLKGKTSSYKMNKPWGYNIQCKEYGQ